MRWDEIITYAYCCYPLLVLICAIFASSSAVFYYFLLILIMIHVHVNMCRHMRVCVCGYGHIRMCMLVYINYFREGERCCVCNKVGKSEIHVYWAEKVVLKDRCSQKRSLEGHKCHLSLKIKSPYCIGRWFLFRVAAQNRFCCTCCFDWIHCTRSKK